MASREALLMAATMIDDMIAIMAMVKIASTKEKAQLFRLGGRDVWSISFGGEKIVII